MSSIVLSSTEARSAFDQLVNGIARQHTRTKFRNHFGNGEGLLDAKIFARATILAERDKPVSNLLQEQPETVRATLFTSQEKLLSAVSQTEPSSITLQELLSGTAIEKGLIVRGRRADLFVYVDPRTDSIYLHRVVSEKEEKAATPIPPKKISRKYRTKLAKPSTTR